MANANLETTGPARITEITEECCSSTPQQGENLPHLSDEVLETIDASSSCHPQQEDVIILNLDFEEMAQAVFGQLDLVDQIIAGGIDANSKFTPDNVMDVTSRSCNQLEDTEPLESQSTSDTKVEERVNERTNEKMKNSKPKEKSRDTAKSKTKEDKSVDHILKALSSLHTTEEKLAALCKKYADLMEEHRNLQISCKQSERRNVQLCKEKEQLQTEHSKAILTRSRLESLCRELQRQNKVVKDESLMRVREEEEKRKEVSAKFQTTFSEITTMLQDNNQKSTKLREENVELTQKLKSLIEQYEMREQQVQNLIKHKEIEAQLAEAKLAKASVMMGEEKEKYIQEKHKLLLDLTEYQKKCHEMSSNEVKLRTQLNLYTEKYEEFQTTITKSNDVFSHFKDEMDKMSKKIKKLEKETGSWRTRWESSNKALLEMAADKQRNDSDLSNAQKKIQQLEKLCRALQTERQNLQAQLKTRTDSCFNQTNNSSGDTLAAVNSVDVKLLVSPSELTTDNDTMAEESPPPKPDDVPSKSEKEVPSNDETSLINNVESDLSKKVSNEIDEMKDHVLPNHDVDVVDNSLNKKPPEQIIQKEGKGRKKNKSLTKHT